ncbi:MAG: hypothetical protein ABR588_10220 [Sphingomicrobium sp.]|nr:hypothetical protein [Sphingomonadales bacterium]
MNARHIALVVLVASSALAAGCSRRGQVADGGVYVTRSACPAVGIVAGTGDVTTFDPAGSTAALAIDVVAAMTNVRATCTDDGTTVTSTARFDVVATRARAGEARQVVLPYFDVAMQGGANVVAKQLGNVGLSFAAGALRAQTSAQATVRISKAAATLPENVRAQLTRERKPGEADAAVDPMSVPAIRDAVASATFEHLLGFQLSNAQLRYNATR